MLPVSFSLSVSLWLRRVMSQFSHLYFLLSSSLSFSSPASAGRITRVCLQPQRVTAECAAAEARPEGGDLSFSPFEGSVQSRFTLSFLLSLPRLLSAQERLHRLFPSFLSVPADRGAGNVVGEDALHVDVGAVVVGDGGKGVRGKAQREQGACEAQRARHGGGG